MLLDNRDLVLDLVEWVGKAPKSYADVMDAWRTSCPRLQIWEDAIDNGFIIHQFSQPHGAMVRVTEKGLEFLKANGRTQTLGRVTLDAPDS